MVWSRQQESNPHHQLGRVKLTRDLIIKNRQLNINAIYFNILQKPFLCDVYSIFKLLEHLWSHFGLQFFSENLNLAKVWRSRLRECPLSLVKITTTRGDIVEQHTLLVGEPPYETHIYLSEVANLPLFLSAWMRV